jgi:hypothetical protein
VAPVPTPASGTRSGTPSGRKVAIRRTAAATTSGLRVDLDHEPAVAIHRVAVNPGVRGLWEARVDLTHLARIRRESTGEHHRHQGAPAAAASADFLHHLHTREAPVVKVFGQLHAQSVARSAKGLRPALSTASSVTVGTSLAR